MCDFIKVIAYKILPAIIIVAIIVCACSCDAFSDGDSTYLPEESPDKKTEYYGTFSDEILVYKLFYTYEEALAFYNKMTGNGVNIPSQICFNYSDDSIGVVFCFFGYAIGETYHSVDEKGFEDLDFLNNLLLLDCILFYKDGDIDSYNTLTSHVVDDRNPVTVPFEAMCTIRKSYFFDLEKYGDLDSEKTSITLCEQTEFYCVYDVWYESEAMLSLTTRTLLDPEFFTKIKSTLVVFK